ncbi:hypothetical protein WICMUC_001052 [Wickerhamomyces mucosus]|uniref:Uncharacterized protein n=1 Tax=Wickerhamomyces mucosus TaxID=1378264 RepID=A0A9P8TI99_9ASCO|nr:hypothetical protein WICMUC_001052 [Wickerhamomyces mucosus]
MLANCDDRIEIITKLDHYQSDLINHGLPIHSIISLINIIVNPSNKFTQTEKIHILDNFMYFKDSIPDEIVYKIINSLGISSFTGKRGANSSKITFLLQNKLLKWLINIRHFLKSQTILNSIYGLIFNFLGFDILRPQIAKILLLITKSYHINQSLIIRLLDLYSKNRTDQYLIGLILLFKRYKPLEILDVFPNNYSIKTFINDYNNIRDQNYLIKLYRLKNNKNHISIRNEDLNYLNEFNQYLIKRRKLGKQKNNVIEISSNLINYYNDDQILNINYNKFFFNENFQISQLISIWLNNNDQNRISIGLNNWLELIFQEFNSLIIDEKLILFKNLKIFTSINNNKIPDGLFSGYLINEKFLNDKIVKLEEYRWEFIPYLSSLNQLKQLIKLYSKNEFPVEWNSKFIEILRQSIKNLINEENYLEISEIIKSIISKFLPILSKFQYSQLIQFSIFQFLKLFKEIPKQYIILSNLVLPPDLIYTLYFSSNNPIIISKICEYLNFSKDILQNEPLITNQIEQLTNIHNSYVRDIINLIWTNKAFILTKSSVNDYSFGISNEFLGLFELHIPLFDSNLQFRSLYNLHQSPTFAQLSAKILRDLEDKDENCLVRLEGPLNNSAVLELQGQDWLNKTVDQVRVDILKKLNDEGFSGLNNFLYSHLRSLSEKQ